MFCFHTNLHENKISLDVAHIILMHILLCVWSLFLKECFFSQTEICSIKQCNCNFSSIISLSAYISEHDKANSLCFIEVSALMQVSCFNQKIGCLSLETFRETPFYARAFSILGVWQNGYCRDLLLIPLRVEEISV